MRALSRSGEPFVWLAAGALLLCLAMVGALLALIAGQGLRTFWPRPVVLLREAKGRLTLGSVVRRESFPPTPRDVEGFSEEGREAWLRGGRLAERILIHTANFDFTGENFRWVTENAVVTRESPEKVVLLERKEWGPFVGYLEEFRREGRAVGLGSEGAWRLFQEIRPEVLRRSARIVSLEKNDLAEINRQIETARLRLRAQDLREDRLARKAASLERGGAPAEEVAAAARALTQEQERGAERRRETEREIEEARHLQERKSRHIRELREEEKRDTLLLREVSGREKEIPVAQVVRAFRPNQLDLKDKVWIYLSRWKEFLTREPREANLEGGVLPAIFGTIAMTLLMALVVSPLGVLAALYLREYARPGIVVSTVRIAVNNLAGVPSIVFGVFGLGFFAYGVGGLIDRVFYPERLPSPTFGTGGLLWASLTLALLTLPVVIVASEEAFAAVPATFREGSYACGASRWQTIRRVVLPHAAPGILTGIILAMARGAGEVAPLMLTGVVKLAPELPIDGHFPFVHLERSFMHLGFHIYDLGFQSPNVEAAKPILFTTALVLLGIVLMLTWAAIRFRERLARRYRGSATA